MVIVMKRLKISEIVIHYKIVKEQFDRLFDSVARELLMWLVSRQSIPDDLGFALIGEGRKDLLDNIMRLISMYRILKNYENIMFEMKRMKKS